MVELALLKIPVRDIERATAFYTEALGLEAAFVAQEYGWASLTGGALTIALYVPGKGGGGRTPGGSLDFHLAHHDIDGLCARIQGRFPESGAQIFCNDDGSRSLEFTDADGNEFKIMGGA